eukprot:351219-Chlamydomonas_euryale.AAC.10
MRRCSGGWSRGVSAAAAAAKPADFGGEVAALYETWFRQAAPSWETHVDALRRLSGGRDGWPAAILDVASGPGQPAMRLAEAFPSATVTATDVSPDMVAKARAHAAAVGVALTCRELDMQRMDGIVDGSVDAVSINYGLMFAADLPLALSEVKRVLAPGGVLTATVWTEMPVVPFVGRVMTRVLGRAPPPPPINPMSLAEPGSLDGPLAAAGFEVLDDRRCPLDFELPRGDEEAAWKLATIMVNATLREMHESGEHGNVWGKAREAALAELQAWKTADGAYKVPTATYRLVVARKPAA